ncbi:MAG TPA: hypothetical protein VG892_12445 [Terriglobales bacterium]|nr:hypothetical protein [Terriglobales bacterium]
MHTLWNRELQQIKRHGLLWTLLLACVGIAYVVAQQGETVDRQLQLIRILDSDSRELHASHISELLNRHKSQKQEEKAVPEKQKTWIMPNEPAPESIPMAHGPRLVRAI